MELVVLLYRVRRNGEGGTRSARSIEIVLVMELKSGTAFSSSLYSLADFHDVVPFDVHLTYSRSSLDRGLGAPDPIEGEKDNFVHSSLPPKLIEIVSLNICNARLW